MSIRNVFIQKCMLLDIHVPKTEINSPQNLNSYIFPVICKGINGDTGTQNKKINCYNDLLQHISSIIYEYQIQEYLEDYTFHNIQFKLNRKHKSIELISVTDKIEFKRNLLGNFEYIQLHGSEKTERVKEIKDMGFKVIKAIKVKEERDVDKYKEFNNADIILFDTPGMEKSLEFPKSLITKLPLGEKYALAGSVSEDNVQILNKLGVNFFDLSSSLESQLGFKDHLKIKNFIKKINEIKN